MLRRPTNSQLIRWSIIIVAFLCSAVLLAYKPAIQIWHNSDSVTHGLASHDTWTPYFWGQDRLGMFFSLFAMGIDDPVNNLLFLNVLFILFVFIMFPLWGYWLTRSKSGIYGGVLASILYSILGGNKAIFVSSIEHPEYAGALMLGFAGMVCLDQVRKIRWQRREICFELSGYVLLLLACWVNITVPIFLCGFFILRWLYYRTRLKYLCLRITMLITAFASVYLPTKFLVKSEMATSTSLVNYSQWEDNFSRLNSNAFQEFDTLLITAGIGYLCLLVMLCNAKTRRNIPVSSFVCLTGAFGFDAFLALLSHVGAQGFGECRSCYSVPATFAILLGGSIAAHRLLEIYTEKKWTLPVLASLTTVTLFITIGLPSKSKVEKAYEQRWGYYRDLLIEHECTHIGGASYYSYDIMFYTNYYYYQQGSDKRLYPYTFRDTPFREAAIQAVDENARIGCILFYDWHYDYYGLNSRKNGIIVPPKAIFKCDRFQVHRMIKIER